MTKDDDIPPTEPKPESTKTKQPRASASGGATATATPPARRTKIAGSALAPDLRRHQAAVETSFWYWIGALPGCPSEHLDLKGIHFPKVMEKVSRGPDGRTVRIPMIGSLVRLTELQIRAMRDRLTRTVIRFTPSEEPRKTGAGASLGDQAEIPRRRGSPVTLPSVEEQAERARNGLPTHLYQQSPHDEPAARYLFAVLCHDQERPQRGDHYPEPLEVTGLEWPGELKD